VSPPQRRGFHGRLYRADHRALAAAARAAVVAQAATALPADPHARELEGRRRSRRAVSAVVDQSKSAKDCQCSPEQVRTAVQTAKLLVQTVYDFLVAFGVIGPNGQR